MSELFFQQKKSRYLTATLIVRKEKKTIEKYIWEYYSNKKKMQVFHCSASNYVLLNNNTVNSRYLKVDASDISK